LANEPELSFLDRAVEVLANAMNAVGLNGTRLQWKWNQRKQGLAESSLRTEVMWRSAKGRHKMCPSCRALVDRSARQCPECRASLDGVRGPGVGRLVSNLLPGISAATSLLMLVNGFWFALMLMAQIKSGSSVSLFGGFDGETLVRFGSGLSVPGTLSSGLVTGGEWWRLVTPIFLHGSLIHFLFNSYLLMNLGPLVEDVFGTPRYWVIYLVCGLAGSMASQLTRPVNTVGASGAIMGLIGLLMVHGFRRGNVLGQTMKSLVIRLAIYTAVLGIVLPIDHRNHIGGFACGALLALLVPHGDYRGRFGSLFWQVLSAAGVLLVLWAFYHVAVFSKTEAGI